ncbi:MAG: benzoyl-CoA 2,3-epoxidase subunit BoxB [Kofleriaceae bacterium]|nr:benzoyl-CoA 2,3-epoxidase subunit BoxB [Kofleriaceae bacterium]
MAGMALNDKIPNNVDLSTDKRLQRALEKWQPNYINWWKEMGPVGHQADSVYLRTALSVESGGWANFSHVKMPDYRWGIFLEPKTADKKIGFGDNMGKPVWDEVPGEFRNALRRLIVTQGDTEPASVEQQRALGDTAPSLYDMRNLFQVNVEEGRHLWAMVYLLHRYFGRDGREEAEDLLMRRSGDEDKPRILGAFNEPTDHWLSFFLFAMFTDRDGKYQLAALAESAFDPLARTCSFMLTEEAHHLFVGETGVGRIIERTCELMKKDPNDDARAQGGVDLPTLQKYINQWYSVCLDLFGGESSSNAADSFASGLKGRYKEKKYDDHQCMEGFKEIDFVEGGKIITKEIAMRSAMNEYLREDYITDCQRAVDRWNKIISKAGISFEIRLPSSRFNRNIGNFSDYHFDPSGKMLSDVEWEAQKASFVSSEEDEIYVLSIMKPCTEPGKIANWIAPPRRGINGQPFEYEYVKKA